ncbi:MAG: three-Cys-motif partner protein TcmP [Oscillospiraceae bacterium]|nr:three-Cys-motif partner protein TcmP [Oscillospiraceae bacterium]
MGKQTKQKGSHFGGEWTIQKLYIIEEYAKTYLIALKNQKVRKIYIDGFAGSGKTELKHESKSGEQCAAIIDGSALLSLKYDFDEYYFLELDEDRIKLLEENVENSYPQKIDKIHFISGDCNEELTKVLARTTIYDRCLMFLDPYALELKWETLEKISKCNRVDLWYLFPLSVVRLMAKNKDISDTNKEKISSILGNQNWLDELFVESPQMSFFDEPQYERVEYEKVLEYIKARFSTIFPFVSPDSKLLKNKSKNAPMFMLCFMMTNKSAKAQSLASKLVKGIIKSAEKIG